MTTIAHAFTTLTEEQATALLDITAWHRVHGHYRPAKRQRPARRTCPACGAKHRAHRRAG